MVAGYVRAFTAFPSVINAFGSAKGESRLPIESAISRGALFFDATMLATIWSAALRCSPLFRQTYFRQAIDRCE